MSTFNIILKELKDLPVERLDDVYHFIHSLSPVKKKTDNSRKKILDFAGAFSEMSNSGYNDFIKETKKTRASLFDRNLHS